MKKKEIIHALKSMLRTNEKAIKKFDSQRAACSSDSSAYSFLSGSISQLKCSNIDIECLLREINRENKMEQLRLCIWTQEEIPKELEQGDLRYVLYSECGTAHGTYPKNFNLSSIDINYCPKCGKKIQVKEIK